MTGAPGGPPADPPTGPAHVFGVFDPRGREDRMEDAFRAMSGPLAGPGWRALDLRPGPHLRAGVRALRADPAARVARLGRVIALGDAALFAAPPDPRGGPDERPDLARLAAAAAAGRLAETEGDYAAALFDPDAPSLTLLRDPFGHAPMMFCRRPDGAVLFATHPHCLLAAPGVSRDPDPAACALFLAIRHPGRGRTYFADIEEAPRGAALRADRDGVAAGPHWRAAPDPALRGAPPGAVREEIRARAETAILSRRPRRGPTAMTLSGGLDSALIAAVLAGAGPVEAFASVLGPDAAPGLTDERRHMAALRDRHPAIALHEVPAGDLDLLAPSAHWWRVGAAPNPDVMHATALLLAGRAADAGAEALLTGFGGDFALSSHGDPALFELLVRGRLADLPPEIARRRDAGGRLRNILIGGFLKPLPLYDAYRRLRPDEAARALPARLRADPAWRARLIAAGGALHQRFERSVAQEEAAALDALPSWTVQPHDLADGRRVAQRTPLLDTRLLSAVLAAPISLKLGRGPDGVWRNRALIRALLRPLVPPSVADRTDKDLFQPDFGRLMRAALPRVRADLAEFARDPVWSELVSPPAYAAALDAAEAAAPAALLGHAHAVLLPWQLGDFLRRVAAR